MGRVVRGVMGRVVRGAMGRVARGAMGRGVYEVDGSAALSAINPVRVQLQHFVESAEKAGVRRCGDGLSVQGLIIRRGECPFGQRDSTVGMALSQVVCWGG